MLHLQLLVTTLVSLVIIYNILRVPEDSTPQVSNIRQLKWSTINFLHTTDTHGWYSGHMNQPTYDANWGDFVSFAAHLKQKAQKNNQDLLLVDTGDRHDGNGLSDVTVPNGVKSLPIFLKQDYDLVTIGNHELYLWENSLQEFEKVVRTYGDSYISTNVDIEIDGNLIPIANKYRYFETPVQKLRVLSFGFIFDFQRNNGKTKVTCISEILQQKWFQDIIEQFPELKVDILVVVGHIPVTPEWKEIMVLHRFLRKMYPNIKIQYFGGHSHIRDFAVYDDNLTALESGRFCETVGWVSIDMEEVGVSAFSRKYIDFSMDSFMHHSGKRVIEEFETEEGNVVKEMIKSTRHELALNKVIGQVYNNYYMDYVPLNHKSNLFKLLSDKVLPKLQPKGEGLKDRSIIINTGSIRYDLYKGPYTIDTQFIISPFKNEWNKVTVDKLIGIQVSNVLNNGSYIMALAPPHHRSKGIKLQGRESEEKEPHHQTQYPFIVHKSKLSKGYVTHDDFGTDGDDTLHRPVINYPVGNVIESRNVSSEPGQMDLVFYNFITGNIMEALKKLTGDDYSSKVEEYSDTYVSELIGESVEEGIL